MAEERKQDAAAAGATEGNLLDEILAEAKIVPEEDSYEVAKRGVEAFITEMLAPNRKGERIDKAVVDAMIAEVDKRMSDQINQILRDYQEGQVCADCIAALLPELTLADIYKTARNMRGWPYYVSKDENK